MGEWYRKITWTKKDEEEFFTKLGRARKDGRAQYLKIQAITLIDTKKAKLLTVAEKLINKLFSDYPNDKFEKSSSFKALGDIYKHRKKIDEAIAYYRKAVDFEAICPNEISGADLEYAELIVKFKKEKHYNFVEKLITKQIKEDEMSFPLEKYKAYSILAIINKYKGNNIRAEKFALLAEENASAETSGFRYHKYLGLVIRRDQWLDNLVKQK